MLYRHTHDDTPKVASFSPSLRHTQPSSGYYAVKPPILASLLKCYGAALSNASAGSCQDPNSSLTNDSDDDADDATDDDDVTTMETVVMEQFLKLAPLLVRASFACACAYWN